MNMLKTDSLLMIAASLLLLVVNWLAFHDFLEGEGVNLLGIRRGASFA
jgi:hypothetical protein